MKKITLFIILGILFNCQAKTSQDSKLCALDLNLNVGEYTKDGKWTIVLNKVIKNGGYIEETHNITPDNSGNATVPLVLGDFNIVSLTFQYANDLKPWRNSQQLFLKNNKSQISLSCFVVDRTLKIDSKDLNDEDNIAFNSFYEQLNEIRKEPGGYSRTGSDAEKFAVRLMEFTNNFIGNHSSIDETLKKYLKIEGYNQSLFRDSQMANSLIFDGNFYDLYDSELILFDNISQIILKQHIDKSLTRDENSQIGDLENKINFINEKLSNPFVKEAIITRYLQSFRSNYIFKGENFQSDLHQFKVFVKNINNIEQRNKLVALFEKTALTKIGANFPSIELKDTEGNVLKSKSLFSDNKYVYIDIWASWCVPCIKEIPALKELEKEYANKNIKFVSISIDSKPEAWNKALKNQDLLGHQFLDQANQIGEILSIQGIPRFLFYDSKGKLISIDAPRPSSPEIRIMLNEHL